MWVGIQFKSYTSWYRYEVYKWQNSFRIRTITVCTVSSHTYTPCCWSALRERLIIQCIGLQECVSEHRIAGSHTVLQSLLTQLHHCEEEQRDPAVLQSMPSLHIHPPPPPFLAVSQWVHVICLRHHSFLLPLSLSHWQALPHSISLSFLSSKRIPVLLISLLLSWFLLSFPALNRKSSNSSNRRSGPGPEEDVQIRVQECIEAAEMDQISCCLFLPSSGVHTGNGRRAPSHQSPSLSSYLLLHQRQRLLRRH